jgi:hypothetical protein
MYVLFYEPDYKGRIEINMNAENKIKVRIFISEM